MDRHFGNRHHDKDDRMMSDNRVPITSVLQSSKYDVSLHEVSGCPDAVNMQVKNESGDGVSAMLYNDGHMNVVDKKYKEIYDGDDQQTAVQKIFEWLAK